MPLNRPAQPLAHGPRAAQEARRWVAGVCAEIGREDLIETCQTALTEVVTNAVLHAQPPLTMRVRGTRDHPRVEVRDSTPEPLRLPSLEPDLDDLDALATFGRGLSIVARCSSAWGADLDGDGKIVWFVPQAEPDYEPVQGVLTGWDSDLGMPPPPAGARISIHLTHVPVRMMVETQRHFMELRRELRLLALDRAASYPVATDLSDFFATLDHDFRNQLINDDVLAALQAGVDTLEVDVTGPPDTAERFARLLDLLDLADAFCRDERLLTLARSRQQADFQRWFFGEFVRQAKGEPPMPWESDTDDRRQSVS